jgi:alpha-tubulin suppressor-like RCC1 family protein
MPNIASHNGIDVGNIASINGQDIAAGGAFNPVADTGTYTETVPTTGMIHYGYNKALLDGYGNVAGQFLGGGASQQVVVNFSSDKDAIHQIYSPDQLNKNWTKIDCSRYVWIGIEGGRLWMASYSTNYVHQTSAPSTITQVTGLSGATDTGWTDCSAGSDFAMAINGGKLFVVGENGDGQLGLGDTTDRTTLTQVGGSGGATDWYKVSCGDDHSAAIKGASGNRALWTTGENATGKCGSGDTSGDDTSWIERVSADASEDWTFVDAGYSYTIAIKAGKLFVTGDAINERFGNNSTTDVTTFTQSGKTDASTFGTNWVSGSASYYKSMLINSSGEVWFAGDAVFGNGSGNVTDAKAGYHVKTSGNASNGTMGSMGGSDDFTFISCFRHRNVDSDYAWISINNGKLYSFGYHLGSGYLVPGDNTNNLTQAKIINSGQTCQNATCWLHTTNVAGIFAYFT